MSNLLDVAAFQPTTSGSFVQALAEAGGSGRIVTGADKLAQRFAIELLTKTGSLKYAPSRGTDFVTLLGGNKLFSEFDIFVAFTQAVIQIGLALQAEESEDDPDEERFDTAEILKLEINEDGSIIDVAVYNLTGSAGTVRLPLTIEPRAVGI